MRTILLAESYTLILGPSTYVGGSVVSVVGWLADLLIREGKALPYRSISGTCTNSK